MTSMAPESNGLEMVGGIGFKGTSRTTTVIPAFAGMTGMLYLGTCNGSMCNARYVSGTTATCDLNAAREEIAVYQRSRFGVAGRSGINCT